MGQAHSTKRGHTVTKIGQQIYRLHFDTRQRLVNARNSSENSRFGTKYTCCCRHLFTTCEAIRFYSERRAHQAYCCTCTQSLAIGLYSLVYVYSIIDKKVVGYAVARIVSTKREALCGRAARYFGSHSALDSLLHYALGHRSLHTLNGIFLGERRREILCNACNTLHCA